MPFRMNLVYLRAMGLKKKSNATGPRVRGYKMLKGLLTAGNTAGTRYLGEELEDLVGKKVGDEGVYLSLDIVTSISFR